MNELQMELMKVISTLCMADFNYQSQTSMKYNQNAINVMV